MVLLIALFAIGWLAAVVLGTQAYFLGEQTKPIHSRNWNSQEFETLAEAITGSSIDYGKRRPAYAYAMDAYTSKQVTQQ
ncbi:MAG: hypothetical protein BJG00_018895 [Limnothrix sp. CACIAM 69d]|jgi:hypothetical protein|nr:MAG: hypothetical protein BJG00_018895 [Limnothrix sp. CACIAM 69d]